MKCRLLIARNDIFCFCRPFFSFLTSRHVTSQRNNASSHVHHLRVNLRVVHARSTGSESDDFGKRLVPFCHSVQPLIIVEPTISYFLLLPPFFPARSPEADAAAAPSRPLALICRKRTRLQMPSPEIQVVILRLLRGDKIRLPTTRLAILAAIAGYGHTTRTNLK